MAVRMTTTLGDLASDLEKIAARAPKDLDFATKFTADSGLPVLRGLAKERSGSHGKLYPRAMRTKKLGQAKWELGPDPAKKQGGMSFEGGSRNQPPHHELADTADMIGTRGVLSRSLNRRVDRWFWNP